MRIQRTDSDTPTTAHFSLQAGSADLEPIKLRQLRRLAASVTVPGFRTGKVPLSVAEKHISPQQLQSDVLETAVNLLYQQLIKDEKLRPVGDPQIELKKFVPFTELECSVSVPVINNLVLPDYKKVRLPQPDVSVTKADIDHVVASLQKRVAERSAVKRAAKAGDEVTIDFSGTHADGQPVAGADGRDYPLLLGSDAFIPGFETELIGLKAGDNKSFTVTFPADYAVAALQKKPVTFTVSIKSVAAVKLPKADDTFAAQAGPFESLKALRADIKKQLQAERAREADQQYAHAVLREIASQTTVDLPQSLIDEQIDRIEADERQNLAYRGQTFDEHLKEEGLTAAEHREQKKAEAIERIKSGLVLSEVAANEQITVTPEEVEIRLQLLRGQYRDPAAAAELEKPQARRDIQTQLITEKTITKLTEWAKKAQTN